MKLVDVFALECHDLQSAQRRVVVGHSIDETVQKRLDRRQRILVAGRQQGETHAIDQRQRYLLAHGVEQGRLVGEMPINRTASHARGRGDVLKRRACDATPDEFAARGAQNLQTRLFGFLLGSTQCGLRVLSRVYIHPRLYNNPRVRVQPHPRVVASRSTHVVDRKNEAGVAVPMGLGGYLCAPGVCGKRAACRLRQASRDPGHRPGTRHGAPGESRAAQRADQFRRGGSGRGVEAGRGTRARVGHPRQAVLPGRRSGAGGGAAVRDRSRAVRGCARTGAGAARPGGRTDRPGSARGSAA